MVDELITMNVSDVLELDYLIEEISDDKVTINSNPSSLNDSYISRNSYIFDPEGTGEYEIEVDGQTVLIDVTNIPDSTDLHSRYDATRISLSDESRISKWSDRTGNGYDLSAIGDPTYRTSVINSNPAVETDGIDDVLEVSYSTISQPLTLFMTIRFPSFSPVNSQINSESPSTSDVRFGASSNSAENWRVFADGQENRRGGSASIDTNYVVTLLLDEANTELRVNGVSEYDVRDPGSGGLAGLSVGGSIDNNEFSPGQFGEILLYPQDKSNSYSEIESYLADKWSITI